MKYFALAVVATFKSVVTDYRYARLGGEESKMLQDPCHRAWAHRPSNWWLYTKLMHFQVNLRVRNLWWGIRNLIGGWLRQWLCAEFSGMLCHGTITCLELILKLGKRCCRQFQCSSESYEKHLSPIQYPGSVVCAGRGERWQYSNNWEKTPGPGRCVGLAISLRVQYEVFLVILKRGTCRRSLRMNRSKFLRKHRGDVLGWVKSNLNEGLVQSVFCNRDHTV